jgi:hypothetical protein
MKHSKEKKKRKNKIETNPGERFSHDSRRAGAKEKRK